MCGGGCSAKGACAIGGSLKGGSPPPPPHDSFDQSMQLFQASTAGQNGFPELDIIHIV
jgi:hypothetical protein